LDFGIPVFPRVNMGWEFWFVEKISAGAISISESGSFLEVCISGNFETCSFIGVGTWGSDIGELPDVFNFKAHDLHDLDGVTDGNGRELAVELVLNKEEFEELGSWKEI